jgi:hypothetical protein
MLAGADQAADVLELAALAGFAAMPWAFLAGLVRSRYSRAGAVGELIERLNAGEAGGGSLRGALANALGDPSLQLLYWRPRAGQYVTHAGHPVELPPPGAGRTVTEVERDGERIGAIVHEEQLVDEPELVRMVAGSAALALENERLEAELRARVTSSSAPARGSWRSRSSSAGGSSATSTTGPAAARGALRADRDGAEDGGRQAALARQAAGRRGSELRAALAELRELRARHPPGDPDRPGLDPALEALAKTDADSRRPNGEPRAPARLRSRPPPTSSWPSR